MNKYELSLTLNKYHLPKLNQTLTIEVSNQKTPVWVILELILVTAVMFSWS